MSSSRVEAAVTDLLIGHRGPAATALLQWLITGDQANDDPRVGFAWRAPGAPDPFI